MDETAESAAVTDDEQLDFLLRSLDDLDAEHDAGDLDADDYTALRDEYIVRIAALRKKLSGATSAPDDEPPHRRSRVNALAWVALVLVIGAAAGFGVAQAAGSRRSGDLGTGDVRASTLTQLRQAQEAMAARDFDEAISLYDDVIAADPSNAEALAYRGWNLFLTDDVEAAERSLRDAAELEETYPDARAFLAILEVEKGDGPAALSSLEALVALDPPADIAAFVPETALRAGDLLLASGNVESTLAAYTLAIDTQPDNKIARTARGWLFAQAGVFDRALEDLDVALTADPDFIAARLYRAITLADAGRTAEACEDLEVYLGFSDRPESLEAQLAESSASELTC